MTSSWLQRLANLWQDRGAQNGASRRQRQRQRPRLEPLEDRLTPAVRVWDGGALLNDNWKDNRNWEGNVAPVAGDELRFPAGVSSTDKGTFNDFSADTRFLKIVVEDGYTLDGNSVVVGDNVAGSSVLPTIETSGNVSISLITIRPFDRAGLVDNLRFHVTSGSLNVSSRITGGTNLLIGGSGTMTMSGSDSNTYTGSTDAANGRLVLAKPAGVTSIPGDLEVESPVDVFNSNQIADDGRIILRSTLRFLGVAETLGDIDLGNSGDTLDVGSGSVVTVGNLTPPLNAFSPGVNVILGSSSSLTTGDAAVGNVTVGSNSTLTMDNATIKFGATVSLASSSVFTTSFLTLKGGVEITGQGALALAGNARFETPIAVNHFAENRINNAEFRLGTVSRTLDVADLGANDRTIISARITAATGVGLTKDGNGELDIAGATTNTYTGTTTVINGLMRLVKSAGLAMSGPLVVGQNTTDLAAHSVQVVAIGTQLAANRSVTVNRTGFFVLGDTTPGTIGPVTLQGGFIENFGPLTVNGNITTLASDIPSEIFTGNITIAPLVFSSTRSFNVADGPAAVDLRVNEQIAGGVGFRKVGAGSMLASVNGNAMGDITLETGTLTMQGGSFTTNLVTNGGTLAGDAILGSLTTNAGSTIASTFTSSIPFFFLRPSTMNLKPQTTVVINATLDSGGRTDRMFAGALTLGDGTDFPILDFRPSASFPLGKTFTIINLTNSAADVDGKFKTPQGTILNEGSGFTTPDGQTWIISYVGESGNDIVLTRDTAPAFANRTLTPRIDEGGIATLSGTITEPNAGDTFYLDVNWGDGTTETFTYPPGSNGLRVDVTHRYLDDGQFNVQFAWRDQLGGRNSAVLPIQVDNVAPALANLAVTSPVQTHQFAQLTGSILDPGTHDSFTLVVDWGDGRKETIKLPAGSTSFSLDHRYNHAGDFEITLTLLDDDLGEDTGALDLQVLKFHP